MNRLLPAFLFLVSISLPADAKVRDHLNHPDDWFHTTEGRSRLNNLLSYQTEDGSWPKNVDTTETPYRGNQKKLRGTFDNSATVNELRLLARAYNATNDNQYEHAFSNGLTCILDSQYENGGWPQSRHPRGYAKHITFNDGTMIGLMTFLREVCNEDRYQFVPIEIRRRANRAFDQGIKCILACQIKVNGQLTVWCAQHDRLTLEPRGARSYEHPSLSGGESAGIACLLDSLDEPSEATRHAIQAAVSWFEKAKLTGFRIEKKDGNRTVVKDATAPPLWARFYDITSGRPIFSGRDGVIKFDFAEIEAERRNGYSWYGNYGARVQKCRRSE